MKVDYFINRIISEYLIALRIARLYFEEKKVKLLLCKMIIVSLEDLRVFNLNKHKKE